jgi:hypothetical protein
MHFDQAVVRLTDEYDVTQATAVAYLNERLDDMLARSEWMMVVKSLGTTVADQANYALAADLVDLAAVKIVNGDDTWLYYGTSLDDLWREDAGDGDTSGFAIDYQADGDPELRLEPAPDTAGLTITGLYAQLPTVLAYGSSSVVPLPRDVHRDWLAGGRADCLDKEGRQDLAAKYEAQYEQGIVKLRRRKNSRGDSAAPQRMLVGGFDYDV